MSNETFPAPVKVGPLECGFCGQQYMSDEEKQTCRAWNGKTPKDHESVSDCVKSLRVALCNQAKTIERLSVDFREYRDSHRDSIVGVKTRVPWWRP